MKRELRGWAKRHPRWALALLHTAFPLLLAAVLCDGLRALAEEMRESWADNGREFREARELVVTHIRSIKNANR